MSKPPRKTKKTKTKSRKKKVRKTQPRYVHGVDQRTGATKKGPNEDAL